jgi:hypothetical protein
MRAQYTFYKTTVDQQIDEPKEVQSVGFFKFRADSLAE